MVGGWPEQGVNWRSEASVFCESKGSHEYELLIFCRSTGHIFCYTNNETTGIYSYHLVRVRRPSSQLQNKLK